jgi:hypothetical protein
VRINKSLITYIPSSGAGSGTVTSVALTAPTGFSVSGSPITSSGTIAISFAAGYSLPTTTKQGQWDSAYAFTSAFPLGTAGQLLRYNTLGTALEFFTPSYLTSADILATTPLVWNSGTKTMSIPKATGTVDGYLAAADFITFGNKQDYITLTTTGNSGAATIVGATLNIPEYTLAGLGGMANVFTTLGDIVYSNAIGIPTRRAGNITTTKMFLSSTGDGTSANAPIWEAITPSTISAVPTSRQLTINGTSYDLTADRSWSVGTVTSVALSVPTGLSVSGSPITTSGTLAISLASGYSIPTTSSQTNWDAAYNDKINSAAVTGTTTKTLTLTQQDGGTITASWTDINTDAVTSVFGRTGAVVATSGDYTTAQVTESGNLYYTDARARAAISLTTTGSSGSATYSSSTGVLNVPTYTASGLGAVPTSRTITINDVVFDLSANRSWSVGDFGTW